MKNFLFWLVIFSLLISACTPTPTMIPPTAIPTPTPAPTPTPQPANDPQALLSRMTLEQKIGQVLVIGFDGTTVSPALREMIEKYHVGGVILFARNVESPRQVAALTHELQEIALKSGHPGLITAIDQEGGRVARLTEDKGFSEFPGGMALGATGDPEIARQVARALAGELKALGLNTDFAPVLDVNNNYKNPVIGIRSFGSDPAQVAKYGVAFLEGLQSEGVLAFGKHFPGHGDTAVDSHLSLPVVPHARERIEAVEFVPFKAAMQAGVAGIMSAHVSFPAIAGDLPATLSPRVLTGLLRDEMGYTGLVATDSIEMGALAQSGYAIPLAPALALQAGADLLLFNRDHALHQQSIEFIGGWLKDGKIPQKRLDEAVLRVLQTKAKFGILNPSLADPENTATLVGSEATRLIAQQAALRSVTLLRDQAGLLPLKKDANLLVIETAISAGLGKALGATAIQLREQASSSDIASLVGTATGRTVIVGTTDAINSKSQTDLVKALLKANIPTIVVAMRGPYDLLAFDEVGTCLVTYGAPPPTLIALKAILMGEAKPQGKLPVEMPKERP